MYILKVTPLKRRIPGGELSYISKSKLEIGSILYVPIKNKKEIALVIECSSVLESKEFLKSLNYSLVSLKDTEIISQIDKKAIKAIWNFAVYSLQDFKDVIFKIFNKTNFEKQINTEKEISVTVSTDKTENSVSFHSFLNIFNKPTIKVETINIRNPELFTIYGTNILGFDILPLFLFLKNEFGFDINFNTNAKRLRWSEWDIKIPKTKNTPGKIANIERSNETKTQKDSPLSEEIIDFLKKQKQDSRILILSSSKNIATRTMCSDCLAFHKCPKCEDFLILVKNNRNYAKKYGISGENIYVCNNCNFAESAIVKCRNCTSWNLTALGYGAEKIEEFLKNNLKGFKIYNEHKNKSLKNQKDFEKNGGIMIDGLNSIYNKKDLNLVIVPSLSVFIYSSSFESGETMKNVIETASLCSEKTIVQTMREEESIFLQTNYEEWLQQEKEDRKEMFYPPYARYILISLDKIASKNINIANSIEKIIKENSIKDSTGRFKDSLGNIFITGSFDKKAWSIDAKKLEIPTKLYSSISPFLKHIKILIY